MRLDKFLCHMNIGSRNDVKKEIRSGYIIVNNEVIKDSSFLINEKEDKVFYKGKPVHYEKYVYILLNKPKDYITANKDNKHKVILDLIKEQDKRNDLFPVGRLDKDTTGLIILTNNGDFSHKSLSPKSHVSKKYYVEVLGQVLENHISMFKNGLVLKDGYKCLPSKLEILKSEETSICIVEIFEGKYHQVKKMFFSINCEVVSLKRISFGNLNLPENLNEGEYMFLSQENIDFCLQ